MVQQDLVVRHVAQDVHHVVLEAFFADDNFHPLAAQHIAGTHQEREAQLPAQFNGLLCRGHCTKFGIGDFQILEQCGEPSTVFRNVQRLVARAHDGNPIAFQLFGQLQSGLPTELNDDTLGLLVPDDVEDVLPKHRLEIQPVRSVAVGGDRFRVAVDHDRLVTRCAGRHHAVNAAVIKFNALANAVGAAAEHHNFAALGFWRFIGLAERAVVIRRLGLEFCGTRIDQSVAALNAQLHPLVKHLTLFGPHNVTDLTVGKPLQLGLLHQVKRHIRQTVGTNAFLRIDQVLNLTQEPRVNLGLVPDGAHGNAQLDGIVEVEQAGPTTGTPSECRIGVLVAELLAVGAEAVALDLKRLASLLQGLLKAPANAHHLAHRLHLQAELTVGTIKLVEVPPRGILTIT